MLEPTRATAGAVVALVLAVLAAGVPGTAAAAPSPPAVERSEVTFAGADGVVLHGTVTAPVRSQGPSPAMVLVHGSGTGRRGSHEAEAVSFAAAGVVTLTYDKREVGYEQTAAGYDRLATDALAGLHLLQRHPGVDPARAGLWGLSEGGWVVPLAAARSADVAFVVLVGASSLPPRRQQEWNDRTDLAHAGLAGSVVDAKAHQLAMIGASLPGVPRADHDPLPALRMVRQPVLALWAAHDRVVPPAESAGLLRRALDDGGNRHYTLRFVPDAEHTMHRSPDGFAEGPDLSPDYLRLVGAWVTRPSDGCHADALPAQADDSVAVPAPSWWETVGVQAGLAVLLVVVFLGSLLAALQRRRPVAAVVLAVAGLLATAGLVAYLDVLVGADADELGPLLAGRPLPWLALQLTAVVTVAATVVLGVDVARRRRERLRLGLLVAGGLLFVPLALTWGLLRP